MTPKPVAPRPSTPRASPARVQPVSAKKATASPAKTTAKSPPRKAATVVAPPKPEAVATPTPAPVAKTPRKNGEVQTFWSKFGAGSLTISILLHVILGLLALFWILQVVHPPEKKVDFMPAAGGGGSPSTDAKQKQHQVKMPTPDLGRVAALGASSKLTLPEPDELSQMTALESISTGGMSGGLGGSGSGGGRGSGNGTGLGSGMGAGIGGDGLKNPFGMMNPNRNALVGSFYDLKQTKTGRPTGYGEKETLKLLSEFIGRGNWDQRLLSNYYKAPNTLYQTKLYIPIMSANEAPNAFGCGDKVKPVNWVALYRGYVTPPRSGTFRFVGRADNVMVVRFNNRVVLDGGDYSASLAMSIWDSENIRILAGKSGDREKERDMRKGGYDIPVKSYPYSTSGQYNERGGVMVGKDIVVKEGQAYPVEILLSELGGLFGAALMIEEEGVEYRKDSTGSPILPLFRLDDSVPPPSNENRGSPAYDPTGPAWRVRPGDLPRGI